MGTSVKENSTEKLLDLIRGVSHKNSKKNISTAQKKIEPANLTPVFEASNLKKIKGKNLNLGVLLNPEDITLVLSSNKPKRLIKWSNIELPENFGIEDEGYALFLDSCLEEFTQGLKKINTWCTIDSAKIQLRNITIPDIARAKIANAAFWGLKKEIEFDADKELFDFEIIGDKIVQNVKKKNILAFSIEKTPVNQLKDLFSKTKFDLDGITTIPFALQNFIHSRYFQIQDSPFAIVNISRQNSEIVCFSNTNILLTRTIRTGSYNLVEDFIETPDKTVLEYLSSLKSIQSKGFLKIKHSCERLIEKIMRTSEYCSQHFVDNIPMKKFFFYGEATDCDPLMEFTAKMTLTDVELFDPVFDALPGSLDVPYPENAYKKGVITTAFAISLSSNDYTPNFLFTHNDKLNKKKKRNINIASSIIFVLIFIFCATFSSWQGFVKNREMKTRDEIVLSKNKLNPNINKESILKTISRTEDKLKLRNQYISDYFPLAVINEICSTTPANIYISSLEADFSDQNKKKNENKQISNEDTKQSKNISAKVIINGAMRINSDSDFAEYILTLGNSKIFGKIDVLEKKIEDNEEDKILNFKVIVEII